MAHAEQQIDIRRGAREVYEFLADGTNNPKWRSGVVSIGLKSGSAGASGAVYSQVLSGPGGRNIAGDYELTVAKPGEELRFQVIAGPARPEGAYLLEEQGDTTTVRFVLDFEPRGLMKLMSSMITRTMQSEVAQLTRLKEVLEAAPAPEA